MDEINSVTIQINDEASPRLAEIADHLKRAAKGFAQARMELERCCDLFNAFKIPLEVVQNFGDLPSDVVPGEGDV